MNQRTSACITDADVVNARLPAPAARTGLVLIDWLLVASIPITFALATWPISGFRFQDVFLRHFSLPVLATELIVILFALSDGFEIKNFIGRIRRWIKGALAALLLIAIGTIIFVAPDKATGAIRTLHSIVHVLFAFSLYHLFSGRWAGVRPIVWPSIAFGVLGYIAILIVFVATIPDPETFDWVFFKLGVTNVRQLGFYSVVGASVAFGLALNSSRKRFWMWLAIAAISLAVSFWSGTRSSLAAFVGAYIIGLRMFPLLRRIRSVGALLISLLVGLVFSLIHQVPSPIFGFFRLWSSSASSDPGSGRLEIWLGTLRMSWERPLFGFGESQFRVLVPEAMGAYNHPHNWVIQILFQWGLVGAACYFALAAYVWIHFEKRVREIGTAAIPAYLLATSILLFSLVEGAMYHPYPIAMLIIGITWVLAPPRVPSPFSMERPLASKPAPDL